MAKIHFFYSTMNAGKSTALLQSNHNYLENGMETMLFIPKADAEMNNGYIESRIGLKAKAIIANSEFDFYKHVKENQTKNLHCILIDEVQFLNKDQVIQIGKITDTLNIPAMCYGIRTDFKGELFEGSKYLLALADNLVELKTVCSMCSRKAIMVVRLNEDGKVLVEGQKIQIGGNETYQVVCRKHFRTLTNLI
jgi:thymidine kinase|tara:strand:+ start:1825 stop:2406 length:582 start_codon:yes stop_codon:yes gene_type:complete